MSPQSLTNGERPVANAALPQSDETSRRDGVRDVQYALSASQSIPARGAAGSRRNAIYPGLDRAPPTLNGDGNNEVTGGVVGSGNYSETTITMNDTNSGSPTAAETAHSVSPDSSLARTASGTSREGV